MGDRAIAVVKIKASALKVFCAEIEELLEADIVDKSEITVRYQDLSTSFHKYEEAYENLSAIDAKYVNSLEWSSIRNLYYSIASKVAKLTESENSSANDNMPTGGPNANSTIVVEKSKLPRLPDAKVPIFNGNYEEWLSYKNAFLSVVNTQLVDDVVKFIHLRSSLEGEALNKVNIFDIRAENYAKAWKTLVDTYERKRILVTNHLNAILDIPPAKTTSSKEVSRLMDQAKQHLNVLEGFDVKIDDAMMVCILERALPFKIRKKWEESIQLDELPELSRLYKFMSEAVFRLCTLEANTAREESLPPAKRASETSRDVKVRKGIDNVRTNTTIACPYCQEPHAPFKCPKFGTLTVQERWDFMKANKLCVNCLRNHRDKCGLGHCKKCDIYHNTLLHSDSKSTTPKTTRPIPPTLTPHREGDQSS